MEHQDSYGCRGCSHGRNVLAVAGAGARRAGGTRAAQSIGCADRPHLLMERGYEGNETRQLALDLGFIPIVPPLKTRIEPWEYDRDMYKRRNEVERLFGRLKGFRRIFSRFEKLDLMFLGFVSFALVADGLRLC
jgi:transposase